MFLKTQLDALAPIPLPIMALSGVIDDFSASVRHWHNTHVDEG